MKIKINDTEIENNHISGVGIPKVKFARALNKYTDKANVHITNLGTTFFPLEEKELKITDDSDNVLWGGIIKRVEPKQLTRSGWEYRITACSWEEKLRRVYDADIYQGNVDTLVSGMLDNVIYDSGFSYNINPDLYVQKMVMENTVLDVFDNFANSTNSVFWVKPDKEINFQKTFTDNTEISISDGRNSGIKSFSFKPDTTQIATTVKLRNCEVLSTTRDSETKDCDGVNTVFPVGQKFSSTSGFVQSGGAGPWYPLSIGVENLHLSGYDLYYNYNDNYFRSDSAFPNGDILKFEGYYYYPFFHNHTDYNARETLKTIIGEEFTDGNFEYITSYDEVRHIKSARDAVEYCNKIINEKKAARIDGNIKIDSQSELSDPLGTKIAVTQTHQGLTNQKFLVTKFSVDFDGIYHYNLEVGSFLFGLEDILEKLLRKTGKELDEDETIPLAPSVSDTLEITETVTGNMESGYLKYGGSFGQTMFS